jgi:uncharacterized protein (TIGR02246 family)
MRIAAFVLVGMLAAVTTTQGGQAQSAGAVDPAIKKIADAYVKAALAGDAKAIAAMYTEDAIEMPPDQPPVKGRAAIEAFFQKQFATMKPAEFSINHIEAKTMGDAGYDVGTYQQSVMLPGAKEPMKMSGKFTVVLKRAGGDWKIAYLIFNTDQPMKPM